MNNRKPDHIMALRCLDQLHEELALMEDRSPTGPITGDMIFGVMLGHVHAYIESQRDQAWHELATRRAHDH